MAQAAVKENNTSHQQLQAGVINITYYTDPLCCWSWAFETEWQKLLTQFQNKITWRYCMGGLLPAWNNYHDAVNSISRPLQMGPMWMHASKLTGVTIRDDIWVKDPPASSYPACIAVKSAALQSEIAAERYLFLLREACMVHAKNIASKDALLEVADILKTENIQFDTELFQQHLLGKEGREAFKKDLQEVKYRGINRFPSLIVNNQSGKAKLLTGYTTHETVAGVLNELLAIKS
ncbi:MAG: DsbA family protein [Parafilimonas sp.]|nr:DsbA family protein [Parafilimonas sp.]